MSFVPSLAAGPGDCALNTRRSSGVGMEMSCGKIRKCLRFSPQSFAAFLRRVHPQRTADNVAADFGVSKRTAEGWLAGEARPNAAALVRAVGLYGVGALCAAMSEPPAWADQARKAEEQADLRRRIDELQSRLA